MLLSIVIPAYDRPDTLRRALDVFIQQIAGKYDDEIEIIVVDDASPGNTVGFVADYARLHPFIRFIRYEQNIGLERNLVASPRYAKGEFLWIFGDDDFLEGNDALDEVVARLRANDADMIILNRTRRNGDLTQLLTPNWMELSGPDQRLSGLREFYLKFGYLSVIGFISVNIFRRAPYMQVEAGKYLGTMYPQLGAMTEAFHSRPTVLVTRPLVCHRTQTAEEKRAALGNKATEADFMADYERRNAIYFSHPHTAMLDTLISKGAMLPEDIVRIPENTVIVGLLIEFLVACVEKSLRFSDRFTDAQWRQTMGFFARLPLTQQHRTRIEAAAAKRAKIAGRPFTQTKSLTVSVVSPSFNQAEFLGECLQSVRDQSCPPIEHLVFDPGSKDGSREIAATFPHVTLCAEEDKGQSDAINKGWSRVKGDIVAWLNSDDVLFNGDVFQKVIDRFNAPDAPDIVYGKGVYINEAGERLRDIYVNKDASSLPWKLQQECGISQPALFMRRSVIERVGHLTPTNHFSMDYEYWIRCIQAGVKFVYLDENFSIARYHTSNKTYGQRGKSYAEVCDMLTRHFGYVSRHWLWRYAEFLADGHDGVLAHGGKDGTKDRAALEREYVRLLMHYNCGVTAYATLAARSSEPGYSDTWAELAKWKLDPARAAAAGVPAYQLRELVAEKVTRPSIAIVTPNYNTSAFIGATIESVISQAYPNLQYAVVDGGSSDGSQAVIEKRRTALHAYISEPDKGHADAINKGFALTSGEIMGWINSDDILLPGALDAVARFFEANPHIDWITGRPSTIDEQGEGFRLYPLRRFSRLRFLSGHYKWVQQESTFWRRSLWDKAGAALDTSVKYAVDMDLWVRFFRHAELYTVDMPLGSFRQRKGQRSIAFQGVYEKESADIIAAEAARLDPDYRYWFAEILPETPAVIAGEELAKREPLLSLADTPVLDVRNMTVRETPLASPRLSAEDWRASLSLPDDISKFQDRHRGKRCFVMGNGPSLNKMDLSKLEGETVFGCNSVFLLFDRIKWRPTYYTCVDSRVLPDRREDIDAMLRAHPDMVAFLPSAIRQYTGENRRYLTRTLIPPANNRYFFHEERQSTANLPFSMFSTDANKGVVQPFTVTVTMLQLAYYMGFSEIYLIGCDTSYVIPKDVMKEGKTSKGELGLALTSVEDNDPNHFDPRYFGKGRQWHDPQTDKMIEHYAYARAVCEATGKATIYNATVGGNLEVFQRVDFNSLFKTKQPDAQPAEYLRPKTVFAASPPVAPAPTPEQPRMVAANGSVAAVAKADTGVTHSRSGSANVNEAAVVAKLVGDWRGRSHIMVDAGANTGAAAGVFEDMGWTVICFEPDAERRARLSEQAGRSPAVLIESRDLNVHPDKPRTGAVTLAEMLAERRHDHLHVLRTDVGDANFALLKSVPWARLRPDVVIFSFDDAQTTPAGYAWEDTARYLRNMGYAIYLSEWRPAGTGVRTWQRVVPYPEVKLSGASQGSILAFRLDPGFEAVRSAFSAPPPPRKPVPSSPPATAARTAPAATSPTASLAAASVPPSANGAAGGFSAASGIASTPVRSQPALSRNLLLFPISATQDASSNMVKEESSHPAPVFVQPVASAGPPSSPNGTPRDAVTMARPAEETAEPPKPAAAPVRIAGPRATVHWFLSHLRRKAMARLVAVGLLALLVAAVVIAGAPIDGSVRIGMSIALAFGALALGGAYFVYKTIGFARRLSAENAELRQDLHRAIDQIAHVRRASGNEAAKAAATINSVSQRLDRSLVERLKPFEEKLTNLDTLGPAIDQLQKSQVKTQASQDAAARSAGSLSAAIDAINARLEALSTTQLELQEIRTAVQRESETRSAQVRQVEVLARNLDRQLVATETSLDHVRSQSSSQLVSLGAEVQALKAALLDAEAVRERQRGEIELESSRLMAALDDGIFRVRQDVEAALRKAEDASRQVDETDRAREIALANLTDDVGTLRSAATVERNQLASEMSDFSAQLADLRNLLSEAEAGREHLRTEIAGQFVAAKRAVEEESSRLASELWSLEEKVTGLAKAAEDASADRNQQYAALAADVARFAQAQLELTEAYDRLQADLADAQRAGGADMLRLTQLVETSRSALSVEAQKAEDLARSLSASAMTAINAASTQIGKLEARLTQSEEVGAYEMTKLLADIDDQLIEVSRAAKVLEVNNREAMDRLENGLRTQIQNINLTAATAAQGNEELARKLAVLVNASEEDRNSIISLWERVGEVATLSEEAHSEAAGLFDRMAARLDEMAVQIQNEGDRTGVAESRLESLESMLADASAHVAAGQEFGAKADGRLKALEGGIARTEEAVKAVSGELADAQGRLKALAEGLAKADGAVQTVGADLAGTKSQVAGVSNKLQTLEKGAEGVAQTVIDATKRLEVAEKSITFDNTKIYQRFNRRLQDSHIVTLEKEWARKLSVSANRTSLGYMAARAVGVEREMEGRLATSIEDVVLRTLVAQATKGRSVEVLEIGTLFGVGAGIMYDALKSRFEKVHFTLLDPLEGYYAQGKADILTGQPVTEKVLRRNLARLGMADDELRLIRHLSTDAEAIIEASERLYDVLVIDADHSYAGVKADFENYARFVRLGGYVIFDDYGSEDWPDVKAYVDAEMPAADFMAPVGNSWRTSVYRVVKPPPTPARVSAPAEAPAAPRRASRKGTGTPAKTPRRSAPRKRS